MSKNTNLSFLTDYITADITNGRIGINNASPTVAFDVVGATKITGVLTLTSTISNGTNTYTLPSATGTLALTSALSGYLPLTGGTLTGALGGTSATFVDSGTTSNSNILSLLQPNFASTFGAYLSLGNVNSTNNSGVLQFNYVGAGNNSNSITLALFGKTGLSINGLSAATFSSSVTANGITDGTESILTLQRTETGASAKPTLLNLYNYNTSYTTGGSAIIGYSAYGGEMFFKATARAGVDSINFYTKVGSTEFSRLYITNAGNVGIGTSSPGTILEVSSGTPTLRLTTTTQNAQSAIELGVLNAGTNAYAKIDVVNTQNYDTNIRFFTNAASTTTQVERMRITSTGNVGIGTSSPQSGLGSGLTIDGASYAPLYFSYSGTLRGYLTGYQFGIILATTTGALVLNNTAYNVLIGTTTDAGYKLTLNGQPGANGYTAWTNYSDLRLKENIQPLVNTTVLDKINLLNPVTFNYNKASGYDEETRARKVSGFIAQELKEIFPEMVGTLKLNDEEYFDTNLSNLSLYLVKAIQELSAEINLLKQK